MIPLLIDTARSMDADVWRQAYRNLARLGSIGIPVDIVFDQGPEVLQ